MTVIERKKIANKPEEIENIVRDRPIKSLVKAVSWRIVGSIDTMVVSYFITHRFVMAISIGGVEVFTKIFLYYLHERAWAQLRWGRMMVRIRRNSRLSRKTFNKFVNFGSNI
jgi:uncharacterized membrane protein